MTVTYEPMRILTVHQPWAHAILHLGKDVENRSRNLAKSFGPGLLAIHAGKTWYPGGDDLIEDIVPQLRGTSWLSPWPLPTGAIIGVVDLVDSHDRYCDTDDNPICSEWAEFGAWHLELANPRTLTEPISYRGFQGMRWLEPEVEAEVRRRLAA